MDARFSHVEPRRPKGGPDGGRDIQARIDGETAYGAVGFKNSATDSIAEKKAIKKKFKDDLDSALAAKNGLYGFVFFTNIDLTPTEDKNLRKVALNRGVKVVDIFYRERLRIALDNARGLAIRFQYLGIELSKAEQATFFNEFGADLQGLLNRKFERLDNALARLDFLQECQRPLLALNAQVCLNRQYDSKELGHFRVVMEFRSLSHYLSTFWIACRDSYIGWEGQEVPNFGCQLIFGGPGKLLSNSGPGYFDVCAVSSIPLNSRLPTDLPISTLGQLDQTEIIVHVNESLIPKISRIDLYANRYLLGAAEASELGEIVRLSKHDWNLPVSAEELEDRWVTLHIKPDGPNVVHRRWVIDYSFNTPSLAY